jgi:hypothetical protein
MLTNLVKTFEEYDRVVVTGPQRSGTQIGAKIIADILKWDFFSEEELDNDRGPKYEDRYWEWVNDDSTKKSVLQCPRMSHLCHRTPKNTMVVFMMRDVNEILESDQHRIKHFMRRNARAGKMEPSQSVFTDKRHEYSRMFLDRAPLSIEDTPQVVYDVWHTIQKRHEFTWSELHQTHDVYERNSNCRLTGLHSLEKAEAVKQSYRLF